MSYFDNTKKSKSLALLIDPDKTILDDISINKIEKNKPDYIFIGGSQPFAYEKLDDMVQKIKSKLSIPIILFPGNNQQIHPKGDVLLALSVLQSSHNKFVLKQLIDVADKIMESNLEVILTPYILTNLTGDSSIESVLGSDIATIFTIEELKKYLYAIKLLQSKCMYLEAGSGSKITVESDWIRETRKNLPSIYLIVGGGVTSASHLGQVWENGADCVVVGNAIEKNPDLLEEFCQLRNQYNT